jgi:hypothetical protein
MTMLYNQGQQLVFEDYSMRVSFQRGVNVYARLGEKPVTVPDFYMWGCIGGSLNPFSMTMI